MITTIVDPLILLYQYAIGLGNYTVGNPKKMMSFFLVAVLAFAVTEYHRYVVYGIDVTYETIYNPVIVPFKYVMNFVRLIFDIFIGFTNAISHVTSTPSKVLIETAGGCLDSNDDIGNVRSVIEAFIDIVTEFATELSSWILNPLEEFNFVPALKELRMFIKEMTALVSCVCGDIFDSGLTDAATAFANTPSFEIAIHNTLNVVGDLIRVPLKTAFTPFSEGGIPRVEIDILFDHLVLALNATADVADTESSAIIDFLQHGAPAAWGQWEMVPVFTSVFHYILVGNDQNRGKWRIPI